MIDTLLRTKQPPVLLRSCAPCAMETEHFVGPASYGFKRHTYRDLKCSECGTVNAGQVVYPWERVA